MFKSPKTTMAGIGAILAAIAGVITSIANDQPVDWTSAISAIVAGVGLITARDHGVSSQQAGVK